jgi:hypothetical protein
MALSDAARPEGKLHGMRLTRDRTIAAAAPAMAHDTVTNNTVSAFP